MEKDTGGSDVEIPEPRLAKRGEILTLHWQDGDFVLCLDSLFTGRVILRRLHTGDEVWIAGLSSSIVESHGLNQRRPYNALVAKGKTNSQGQPTIYFEVSWIQTSARPGTGKPQSRRPDFPQRGITRQAARRA